MSFADRVRGAEDLGPLPWWAPTQKTPWIIGVVVEYRRVNTEYGELTGAAVRLTEAAVAKESKTTDPYLAQPGELVMVWLKNTVLRNSWNAPNPVGGPPGVGETVGCKRLGTRSGSKGTYPVFQVMVDGREGMSPTVRTPMTQRDALGDDYTHDPGEEDPNFGDPGFTGEDDLPF